MRKFDRIAIHELANFHQLNIPPSDTSQARVEVTVESRYSRVLKWRVDIKGRVCSARAPNQFRRAVVCTDVGSIKEKNSKGARQSHSRGIRDNTAERERERDR